MLTLRLISGMALTWGLFSYFKATSCSKTSEEFLFSDAIAFPVQLSINIHRHYYSFLSLQMVRKAKPNHKI